MKVSEVGAVVRAYRKATGISQKELASLVGISRATLNYLESGREGEIGASKLLAMLELLGVPFDVPQAVDREHDDRILDKAGKSAGAGKVKLPRKVLVEALATGICSADVVGSDVQSAVDVTRGIYSGAGHAGSQVSATFDVTENPLSGRRGVDGTSNSGAGARM